jgi:hypothetical protein
MAKAQRYDDLAVYARAHGYLDVTGPAVHHWTKGGLLPRAQPHHYGQARRTFSYPVRTGAQLLALCELRFALRIRDLGTIALRLWLEGYELPLATVRRALYQATDLSRAKRAGKLIAARRGSPVTDTIEAIGTFAGTAVVPGRQTRGLVNGPIEAATLAEGLTDYVALSLGAIGGPGDRDGREAMGKIAGLTPAETEQLPSVAALWAPDRVRVALQSATPRQISAARLAALRVADSMKTTDDLSPIWAVVPLAQRPALFAAAFLVLRAYDLARDVLAANEPSSVANNAGASALRYR